MAVRASDRVTLATLPAPSYVRTYYLLQDSTLTAPAKPVSNPPAAPWTTTEPAYTAGATVTLYTAMVTVYGTVSFEWGDVQKSAAFEAAKQAYNLAAAAATTVDGTRRVRASITEPAAPAGGWINGDQWWQYETVAGVNRFTAIKIWNGTAWVPFQLIADSLLIPGSIGNILLDNGAIDGMTITGATIRTAASGQRVQLDVNGLRTFDSSNTETANLASDDTGLRLTGVLRSWTGVWADNRATLSSGALTLDNPSVPESIRLSRSGIERSGAGTPLDIVHSAAGVGSDIRIITSGSNKIRLLGDIEYQDDSGWVNLTSFGSGWSATAEDGYAPLRVRKRNGVVELRGIAHKASFTAFETIATLPTEYRPATNLDGACRHTISSVAGLQIFSDGSIRITSAGTVRVMPSAMWTLG